MSLTDLFLIGLSIAGLIVLPEIMRSYNSAQKIVHYRKQPHQFVYSPRRH